MRDYSVNTQLWVGSGGHKGIIFSKVGQQGGPSSDLSNALAQIYFNKNTLKFIS